MAFSLSHRASAGLTGPYRGLTHRRSDSVLLQRVVSGRFVPLVSTVRQCSAKLRSRGLLKLLRAQLATRRGSFRGVRDPGLFQTLVVFESNEFSFFSVLFIHHPRCGVVRL